MSDRLEAWLEGQHVGQFVRTSAGTVSFVYSDDAPSTPISLSLPRYGGEKRAAAANLLDNLLPDQEHTRVRMAQVYGAESTGTFDLLHKAGGDVAGGLVLMPEGQQPSTGPARLNPALSRDVADRINSIKLDPDAWVPRDVPTRFSLAGTQGKFALARVDLDWYWSNETVPSTHIIKPGRPDYDNLESAEDAVLTLAADIGIPAPKTAILHEKDQTAFLIERFDRLRVDGQLTARRLHAEDLAQALGVGPGVKYNVTAAEILEKLATIDVTGDVSRAFLQQLIFNTLVGNADAHAKNYSVLLRPDAVTLAPLYDVVPLALYPQFEQKLAMRIAGARFPQAVTRNHWRKFARDAGFDPDELLAYVDSIASGLLTMNETAWASLAPAQSALMRKIIERNTSVALAEPVSTAPRSSPTHQDRP